MLKKFLLTGLLLSALWRPLVAEDFQHPRPVHLDHEGDRWARKTLKKLTLEEKVGQMFMIRVLGQFMDLQSPDYLRLRDLIQRYHLGSILLTVPAEGPFLYKTGPYEAAMLINQLQRDAKVPLIVGADFERGLSMRLNGVTTFPHAMAFGAAGKTEFAAEFGRIVAEESRAIGVEWNFFPVADVNSNPQNPIINTRSFGEDPAQVSDLVAAFIQGSRSHGMLTTVKHFPGHGDTGTDSHLGVARVEGNLAHVQTIELPPFKKAIAAGVDSVMVAHLAVPALEPDANKVATISEKIIDGALKTQLGFKGVVVTDALEMRGLTSLYPPQQGSPTARAAVDAVKAGNDVILWPTDLDGAFNGIIAAVKSGQIPESRIDESVKKILEMKASVGLDRNRLVDLDKVPYLMSKPEDMQFAQQVADQAVTLVRDNGRTIPLGKLQAPGLESETFRVTVQPTTALVALIITDSIHGDWGRNFETALKSRRIDAAVF